ncbi:TetR/AcrR family transcriptional regulator [Mycobacterium sp.]|uniref:TetR/AcrR family transcriptional regulator n=1 Tax=Mycobacterium sp. TaxID=1785 RepID=UPI002CABE6CF|nr:TetR family transcriptional regulator [Mycobacterium sp.]HTQ21114.1 TetR family transcriptional regulator [Mycobacterium sp.]
MNNVVASRRMSNGMSVESARRRFTGKRADTVLKLGRATLEVLRDVGYQELTLQAVAAQAGLARATAYTYFSSKEHLIAEVFWRRMSSIEPAAGESDVVERVAGVLRDLAFIVADEPALAHAVAVTMNSGDPDVELLRVQMGRFVHDLLTSAAGEDGDPESVQLLELIYIGVMVRAAEGTISNSEVADQLDAATRRILSTAKPKSPQRPTKARRTR